MQPARLVQEVGEGQQDRRHRHHLDPESTAGSATRHDHDRARNEGWSPVVVANSVVASCGVAPCQPVDSRVVRSSPMGVTSGRVRRPDVHAERAASLSVQIRAWHPRGTAETPVPPWIPRQDMEVHSGRDERRRSHCVQPHEYPERWQVLLGQAVGRDRIAVGSLLDQACRVIAVISLGHARFGLQLPSRQPSSFFRESGWGSVSDRPDSANDRRSPFELLAGRLCVSCPGRFEVTKRDFLRRSTSADDSSPNRAYPRFGR